ncbi:hypothetical protein [Blastomonas sp. UPD001]|uniref:hypothetical protein n=1 Tax=Blastomonas sp. UPD001 TaxID=2217673 RepID=UPI000E34FE9B|nr:hypothetical protein [Blastomonas sp. UPD001]
MRSRLFQTGLALVLLGIAAPDSAISQTAPQVRNAPDFAGIIAGYRTQRAKDPDSCCTYSAPVFGREVRFHLFGTFEPAYEAKNDRQMILEFVPQGESVQNWTRMITLSAFRGTGSAPISTAEMQQRFFNTNRGCETASFSRVIASGRFADGTEYNLSSNGCGSTAAGGYPGAVSGRGEQFVALLLRDAENVAVLQYAERSAGFDADKPPIGDDAVEAVMSRFRSIAFCRGKAVPNDCSIAFSAR